MNKPRFGVWDTEGRCWIGQEEGPVVLDSMRTASLLADAVCIQFVAPGRFKAAMMDPREEFIEYPNQKEKWIEGKMTVEEALKIKQTENKNHN